jgi:hypothetical protein
MSWEQGFHARPHLCEQGVEVFSAQIAKTEMDDPRRRRGEHDAVREVGIFGDNGKRMFAGMIPKSRIRWAGAQGVGQADRKRWCEGQSPREILVERKSLQATSRTEK